MGCQLLSARSRLTPRRQASQTKDVVISASTLERIARRQTMTIPMIALLTATGLLVVSPLLSRNKTWVCLCPRCGFTALPKGSNRPAACPNRHPMRVMYPGLAYATIMFLGDIAMCVLVVHFVLQRFMPWASGYFAWILVFGVFGALKDLSTIPIRVSEPSHASAVKSHYGGALVGHLLSTPLLLLAFDMRVI